MSKSKLQLTMAILNIFLVSFFLLENVRFLGFGVAYFPLLLAVVCSLFIFLFVEKWFFVKFRISLLWLVFFLVYFVGRLLVDSGSLETLKAFTIGTSGGVLFALVLGMIVSYNIKTIHRASFFSPRFAFFLVFLYSVAICIVSIRVFGEHYSSVRADIFLIQDQGGFYQRPGNFMFMQSLIFASCIVVTSLNVKSYFAIFNLLLFFLSSAVLMILSQLIGSNSGFVAIGGVLVIYFLYLFICRSAFYLDKSKTISFKAFLGGWLAKKVLAGSVICMIIFLNLIILSIEAFSFDVNKLRIFGFGGSGISSIESRLKIFNGNFFQHLSVSPFWGNTQADVLTTGTGSYVHSLLSILPALGIFGTMIFLAFLFLKYREILRRQNSSYKDKRLVLFCFFFLSFVLLCSLLWASYTWMPLWFAIGLFGAPLCHTVPSSPRSSSSSLYCG